MTPRLPDIALLRSMIETPSLSTQEAAIAELLVREMRQRGLEASIDAAGNAVGTLTGTTGSSARPLVLLLGHMDTVSGEVPIRQDGDLLYGRGAVDAKGPLATFIAAATHLAEQGLVRGRLVVVGAVEEEAATSKGARALINRYQPDFVVIGEPSGWQKLTLGYKGRLLSRYTVHASTRHTAAAGPSACEMVVSLWNDIVAWSTDLNQGKGAFDSLTPSLRSFSSTSDGIADQADALIAFRLPVSAPPELVIERVQAMVAVRQAGQAKIDHTLETWAAEPAVRMDKQTPLVRAFLPAIRGAGGTPVLTVKTGTSDMNVVSAHWSCPMLAYGPGDSSLDHTPHEHIDLQEYGRAIGILTSALTSLFTR